MTFLQNLGTRVVLIMFVLIFFSSAEAKILDIQHWKTPKGTPVYFVQTKQVPVIMVRVIFDAGSARDNLLPGTSALVNTLLDEGNEGLTATQMAEGFDDLGAEYAHGLNRDMAIVQLKTITDEKTLPTALNYFTKIFKPDFPVSAFEREKKQQLIAIAQNEEEPNTVAQKALLAAIYPNHPYGKPTIGIKKSVAKIQLSDIKEFYNRYYTAKNAVISIAGNVDLKTAQKIAEQVTQNMSVGKKAEALPVASSVSKAVQKHISYPAAQTAIRIGQVGISHHDPDYYALMVGNYSLGGGTLVSRLSDEIREKRGLAYNVMSYFDPLSADGPFAITLATRTEKSKEALKISQQTLQQFVANGPSDTELASAKQFIKGNFPLRFETNAGIIDMLSTIGFYHLPLDHIDTYLSKIEAVTTEEIKTAFQNHIHPEKMVTITVGKNVPSKNL